MLANNPDLYNHRSIVCLYYMIKSFETQNKYRVLENQYTITYEIDVSFT